jgi:hypothetical protein
MHLVDKQQPSIVLETLSDREATALRQWFEGCASPEQERQVHGVLRSARAREAWIACDCMGDVHAKRADGLSASPSPPNAAPLSAPVLANGVYTIRRLIASELAGVGPRPNHHPACPLHYDEAQFRERIGTDYVERPHLPPTGPIPGLLQISGALGKRLHGELEEQARPCDAAPVPATAVSLWRLMHQAGLNTIQPDDRLDATTIASSMARLRAAAGKLTVSHNLPWSAVLSTFPGDYVDQGSRWRRSFHKIAEHWRRGERPTAAMLVATRDVAQFAVVTLKHGEIPVRALVRRPVRGDPRHRGPYLVLVLFAVDEESNELVAEKAYAQPVVCLDTLLPVDSAFEREIVARMREARAWLAANDPVVRLQIAKPLFDLMSDEGPCRPDILINAWTVNDPRPRRLILEAEGMETERYRAAKAITQPRMRRLAPVETITLGAFRRAPDAFTAWFTDAVQELARRPPIVE